jgi:hypothetical protein
MEISECTYKSKEAGIIQINANFNTIVAHLTATTFYVQTTHIYTYLCELILCVNKYSHTCTLVTIKINIIGTSLIPCMLSHIHLYSSSDFVTLQVDRRAFRRPCCQCGPCVGNWSATQSLTCRFEFVVFVVAGRNNWTKRPTSRPQRPSSSKVEEMLFI